MILTSIFWVGWLTWKLKDPPNTDKAERRFPNESCFEILVQRRRKKKWVYQPSMATVLLKTMKFFKVPIIIPISYWIHFSNTHYYYLLWDQTQQSKPVAQPFQQTQWTHRPIRLHLLSPATRASMSSLLSLQASFTVLFLSLSLSIRISPTCMWSYFLDNYEQTWLHFGVLFYSENYLNTKSIHLHFLSLGSSSSNLSVQLQQHNKDKPTSDLSIYIYIYAI